MLSLKGTFDSIDCTVRDIWKGFPQSFFYYKKVENTLLTYPNLKDRLLFTLNSLSRCHNKENNNFFIFT